MPFTFYKFDKDDLFLSNPNPINLNEDNHIELFQTTISKMLTYNLR